LRSFCKRNSVGQASLLMAALIAAPRQV